MRQMSGKFALVLALGFGLTASLMVWVYLKNATKATLPVEMASVVVAAADLPPRTLLTKEMLRLQMMPVDARHPRAFTAIDKVEGKVTRLAITGGEQVLDSKVFAEREESGLAFVIPPNKRAVSVGISEVIGSGGLIVPGDRVDVVAVFDSQKAGKDMATVVLQDVEVLAVAQMILGEEPVSLVTKLNQQNGFLGQSNEQPRADPKAQPAAKSVTLAVAPDEAQRLILAEEKGKIRLALRAYGDRSRMDAPEAALTSIRGLSG
ncbi:MAG: Flp pilus assembly protein CpaB [Chloroflexi bacterium]|nr:Flp pilus assembly protein CpaB [Chloroflexota bacterium]